MAQVVLVPWPTTPAAVRDATACLRDAIRPGPSDERLQALGETAAALIVDYAPSAPSPLQREACIRAVGWLSEQPMAARRSGTVGDITRSYSPSMIGVLLHSGAKSLLYPYRTKRAGVAK